MLGFQWFQISDQSDISECQTDFRATADNIDKHYLLQDFARPGEHDTRFGRSRPVYAAFRWYRTRPFLDQTARAKLLINTESAERQKKE